VRPLREGREEHEGCQGKLMEGAGTRRVDNGTSAKSSVVGGRASWASFCLGDPL
jgi:hypothetical protein